MYILPECCKQNINSFLFRRSTHLLLVLRVVYPLFGKHSVFHWFIFISVFSGTSQVSQAWLLPCYPLCRLIQQVLFYHQTCSYLLLRFPLLFLYTDWGFDKENCFLFSCTTSLSSRKIKTFIAMMLVTNPLQSMNETGCISSTSVGCGSI